MDGADGWTKKNYNGVRMKMQKRKNWNQIECRGRLTGRSRAVSIAKR